jgi:Protein of unknown function (DUF3305)
MSATSPLARIPVGVMVERRKATSPWIEFTWHPFAVLPGRPEAAPWSPLSSDATTATYYVGLFEIELYRTDTGNYRHNLASALPSLWIVLRPTGGDPPFELQTVTADPAEGESYTQAGSDLVGAVPMHTAIRQMVDEFVVRHHVEQSFHKRKREHADPDALPRPRTTDRRQAQ